MMQHGKKEDKLREQIQRGKMDGAGAGWSNERMYSPRSNRSNKVRVFQVPAEDDVAD
jgi:hypothetical protein